MIAFKISYTNRGLMAVQTYYLDEARATISYKRKIYQIHKGTPKNITIKHTHLSRVLPSTYYFCISKFFIPILSKNVIFFGLIFNTI